MSSLELTLDSKDLSKEFYFQIIEDADGLNFLVQYNDILSNAWNMIEFTMDFKDRFHVHEMLKLMSNFVVAGKKVGCITE